MESQKLLDQLSAIANEVPLPLVQTLAVHIEKMSADAWSYQRGQVIQAVPQPALQLLVGWLLDTWRQECPTIPAPSIALALRAAGQAAETRRRAETTSLVWTGPTRRGPALRRTDQALLQVINTAQQQLLVVSFAVYNIANIRQALVKAAERGVSLKICVEAPEASEGKVAYDTVKALGQKVAQHATVYLWPADKRPQDEAGRHGSLHVKCAVADTQLLFISSANLTAYALTLNMELGVLIQGGPLPGDVVAHFNRLIEEQVLVPV